MGEITVAACQMRCTKDMEANVGKAEAMVRQAAAQGGQIVLLQELFASEYFCKDQDPHLFELAAEAAGHPLIRRMQTLAAQLGVVLPVSFFEKANQAYFNSVAVIDADGQVLGIYRKSHIPDGPGYQEKYYFNPGDTGFLVWRTRYGTVGVGICWDQWFPECARAMVLQGADILLYPTAIGSEPADPEWDSAPHWMRVMQGHAAANLVPVVAVNRVGTEEGRSCSLTFYGSSFIADATGAIVVQAGREEETIIAAGFDFEAGRRLRRAWGVFRDRRPDLYGCLLTLDGRQKDQGFSR